MKNNIKWYDMVDYLVGGMVGFFIASLFTTNVYIAAIWFVIAGIILDTIMRNRSK